MGAMVRHTGQIVVECTRMEVLVLMLHVNSEAGSMRMLVDVTMRMRVSNASLLHWAHSSRASGTALQNWIVAMYSSGVMFTWTIT